MHGTSSRKKKAILVAEDNAHMRASLRVILEYGGFHVTMCPDCCSAIEQTQGERYDVFLVDYFMPDCNGLVVARRARERYPRSCIIGMSLEDRRREFMSAGADDFLLKPLDLARLMKIIDKEADKGDEMGGTN